MPIRRKGVISRWLDRAVKAAVSVAVLVICLAALSRTPWVKQYAGYQATRALQQELGLQAVIHAVEIDTLGLAVVATDITLDHQDHGRFVEAKVLRIRPSWWALMRGQVDLHAIEVEQATVFLQVRDERVINLPEFPEASDQSDPSLELPFNFVTIRDSTLMVDAGGLGHGQLDRINVRLDASDEGALGVEIAAWDGYAKHPAGRDSLTALELSAVVTRDRLHVDLARVATPEVELSLRDAHADLPFMEGDYAGSVELDLDVSQLDRWPHGWELPKFEGQLRVAGQLRGHGEQRPTAEGSVELNHGRIDIYGLGNHINLDVKMDQQGLSFQGADEQRRGEGRVGLRGRMGFEEGLPLEAYADIRDVSFAKLMDDLSVSPDAIIDWNLTGNWTLNGTLDPLDLSGPMRMPTRALKITREAYHQSPSRHVLAIDEALLDGTVAIRPAGLSFEKVDITLPHSELHADVLLGFDNRIRVTGKALSLDLQDVTPLLDFELAGRGSVDFGMDGTFTQPTLTGAASFAGFAFHTYPFGDITTDFELQPSLMAVLFPRLEGQKNESRYKANDFLLDFADHRLSVAADVEVAKLLLSDFYHVFHWEDDERYESYQGELNGGGRITYTLGFPDDKPSGTLTATGEFDLPRANIDGYDFTEGHFAGQWLWLDHEQGYRGGELSVERLSLRKGKGTVNVSGKMAQGGGLDMVVVADKVAVKDTEGMADHLPGLEGSFGITGTVNGTAAVPRMDMDVAANGLRLGGKLVGDGRLYVRLTDKQDPWIQAAKAWPKGAPPKDEPCGKGREGLARGQWPADPPLRTADGPLPALDEPMAWVICGHAVGGQLDVDMMVGRTRVKPVRGELRFAELDFGRLLPDNRSTGPLHGSATGSVRLFGGAMKLPQTLIGDVQLSHLQVGQKAVELRNDGPVKVSFDRGEVKVHNATFIGPSSQLYITGGASTRKGLGLTVDGKVDLGLLTHLSDSVTNASGEVDLRFKVGGMLKKPSLYGHANVLGASLKVASFGEAVSGIYGKVTFSAQRVLFENFQATVAGGKLGLSGVATLQGQSVGSYHFDLEGDHVDLSPRDGIVLVVGGHGSLDWRKDKGLPTLGGTLRLDRMAYTRPIKMGRTLQDMVKRKRASVETYDPEADLLALDLTVVQAKPLYIKNNLIEAEMLIRDAKRPFRLVGTDQRFGVVGDMSVKKGTINFRDANFEIRDAAITFEDKTRIDPTFDIRAVTDVRRTSELAQADWHIAIHAWGNRDSFQFDLQSDPYLSKDDIALLLTVGMTHSELSQLETGDLTGTAALEALASVTGVEREVHRALPEIDDFHISSAYSERSNRTEPQLFIGKRVADNVRLSASTGLSESRDFSTGVELQLSDQTSVEAVYNNQNATSDTNLGDVGVDLKWRLEFD